MTAEVLSVFGATGQTGKHVVEYALELGWKVRALARTPSKMEKTHDNLTIIEGDFANGDAIRETLQGASCVICVGGGPHNPRQYETGFMEKFIREQLWPALQETKPKSFLYQAGALSKVNNFPKLSQYLVAPMLGLGPMVKDNDAVIQFIQNHPLESTFVIVTRPGALISGRGGSPLRTHIMGPMMPVYFADLGKFNVEAVTNEKLAGKYPYISRKYGF